MKSILIELIKSLISILKTGWSKNLKLHIQLIFKKIFSDFVSYLKNKWKTKWDKILTPYIKVILFGFLLVAFGPIDFFIKLALPMFNNTDCQIALDAALNSGELVSFSLTLTVFIIADITIFSEPILIKKKRYRALVAWNLFVSLWITIIMTCIFYEKYSMDWLELKDQALFVGNAILTTVFIKYKLIS